MIPAWTGQAVRDAERPFLDAGEGPALMRWAAHGLALECVSVLRRARGSVAGAKVVVLAGSGNNGGDALWAAADLRRRGAGVEVISTGGRLHEPGADAVRAAGGRCAALPDMGIGTAARMCLAADLLLDGVLGTGAEGGLRGPVGELVERVNQGLPERSRRTSRRPQVVAVDLPSGVEADTGRSPGEVLGAVSTVTFGGTKAAHVLPPGRWLSGTVSNVAIGIEGGLPVPAVVELEDRDLDLLWPRPTPADHKYTRGVVGVVAGSPRYPGAALLCTRSAVAAGAGMVRYLGDENTRSLVTLSNPEVVSSDEDPVDVHVQAWVAGPGAVDDDQRRRIDQVLASEEPAVLDAGAIAAVGQLLGERRLDARQVLTPHAGELVELLTWCHAWGLIERAPSREEVEGDPAGWAGTAATATGATVLLKGAVTVVAAPSGGPVVAVANGSPWLASAGSGDCLAGLAGTLLAHVAGRPDRFDRQVQDWLEAAPLEGGALEGFRDHVSGDGRWALAAALAAVLHGRASTAGGEGPAPCRPEYIRAALTSGNPHPRA
ncbi:bifunctional ADP-dependent NAD(P)H-hydrate dehydratase/NAD(P)H-hydrate epimerase [Kocuria coralli]|uniref:ADP-dependent (S)-NAD(P)H-hydrate dehydratase n=1 Tax=Kocuria coralli TaxID=1461025 RepID=A0A5J5L013_9MICC|nr:bifunctional ADP-dependent NAD(P)H-hydrate dehydratase/NAD(P)H-hydrate epimerase [Kocuria coralli]KAA9395163.1 bifunctional ADP-dependent NAD(P)H-hydrate dehydratase/NAD(P)H-hydrate epimerase [Kocuria coralli]